MAKITALLFPLLVAIASPSVTAASTSSTTSNDGLSLYKAEKYSAVIEKLGEVKEKTFEQYRLLIHSHLVIDVDDAEEAAEQMLTDIPQNFEAHQLYASVMGEQAQNSLFSALSYAEKALNGLEKAMELAPDNTDAINGVISFHLAAPSIAGGDKDVALKLIEEIKKLDPTEAQFTLARYYLATDESEKAEQLLKSLLTNEQTKFRALFALSTFYSRGEQYAKAMDYGQQAIAYDLNSQTWEDPKESDSNKLRQMYAYFQLGALAKELPENYQDGIAALNHYLNEYAKSSDAANLPSRSSAKLQLGELLMKAGKKSEAKLLVSELKNSENEEIEKESKKLLKKIKKA